MLRQFYEYYRPWKRLFWLDFGCAVLSGLLELAFPLAVAAFIDDLLPSGDMSLTVLAAIGLLLIYFVNAGLMTIVIYWGHKLGINIETEMRRRAFEHLQKLSFSYFDRVRTGKLVARVTRDLEEIGEVAHHGPEDLFIAVMPFVGAFLLMLTIAAPLALITAAIVPACVAYKVMAASSALNYMGMRLIQVVVMVVGAVFVLNGSLTTGGFVGFLLLVNVFFRPLDKIAAVIEVYPRGIAGFRRYLDLMSTRPDVSDRAVAFEAVDFTYGGPGPVVRDVSLSVRPGETMAFVGPSGAGKTTLLALVPRFYEPQSGRILIDGIDVADMTLQSLRRQVGIVSQDVFLFGGTLRENIAYGRLGASEADILEAADRAQLTEMIAGLPEGLETIVGERGVMLSGGQKQRVAIARAFLKNPPILILDEATSALDTETERLIQSALEDLSRDRTTLVIAHRLGTIRDADRIAVMDQGRIVEMGTHDELREAAGRYASLSAA